MMSAEDLQHEFQRRLKKTLELENDAFDALTKTIQEECSRNCKDGIFSKECQEPMKESLDLMYSPGSKFESMKDLEHFQFSCQNMVKVHKPEDFFNTCVESQDTSKPNEMYNEELCDSLDFLSSRVESLFVVEEE